MKKQTDPKQIRQSIRKARRAIPPPYSKQASYKFSERFAELPTYQSANKIAGFLPFDGESDPLPLMDRAIQDGKSVYVPIIIANGQPLLFAQWTRTVPMKRNQFGIDEPNVDADQLVKPAELDFVITPLVAFDENCNRMGVGGGFYDRSFAFLNDSSDPFEPSRTTTLVGIAYELQKVPKLFPQDHDVPLSGVVTELAFYSREN